MRRTVAILVLLVLLGAPRRAEAVVDLHNHLFMKPGLGWLFRGSFEDGIAADHWGDRLFNKTDAESLERSGLSVVVVSLFAHPVFVGDLRDAIRTQIHRARDFLATHPGWGLARNAAEAEALVNEGKRVMVFSLEGAWGVLESEEDLVEFVDGEGIAIVAPLHLTDDHFGGAAAMTGFQVVANPLGFVDRLLDWQLNAEVTTHPRGLTPMGRRLLYELVARGVWVDLTHASDQATDEMLPILAAAGQPLLYTHTSLRELRAEERRLSRSRLAGVAQSGGVVGLLPSEDAFVESTGRSELCPRACAEEACGSGVVGFAEMVRRAATVLPPEALQLGTDFNGGMRHLAPSCGVEGRLATEGLVDVGQVGALWSAARRLGAPLKDPEVHRARFLSAWSKVVPIRLVPRVELPPLPPREDSDGPSLALGMDVGAGSVDGTPAFRLALEGRVRKDLGRDQERDPEVYFARFRGEIDKGLDDPDVPWARLRFAPLGVVSRDYEDALRAEALVLDVRRSLPLDQAWRIDLRALSGSVSTMPAGLKSPGHHAWFIGLEGAALGYRGWAREEDGRRLHGVYLAGARAFGGLRLDPSPSWRIRLEGGARASLATLLGVRTPDGWAHQTELSAYGRLTLGGAVFWSYVDASLRAARSRSDVGRVFLSYPHILGGFALRP